MEMINLKKSIYIELSNSREGLDFLPRIKVMPSAAARPSTHEKMPTPIQGGSVVVT